METATEKTLEVGDSVYRAWDAAQEPGTIISVLAGSQFLVTLKRGKTWIYHKQELELVPVES